MPPSEPTPSVTLHGDALAWLELQLAGLHPAGYGAGAGGPLLSVPAGTVATGGTLDLLDPEGVTLARLPVAAVRPGPAGDELAGVPQPVTPIAHPDHLDLRRSPADLPGSRTRVAVWGGVPSTLAFRRAALAHASAHGADVLELVGVPAGRDTDAVAHLPARLARHESTRRAQDALVVVTVPTLGWDEPGLRVRCLVAGAFGAAELVVPVGVDPVTADRLADQTGARPVGADLPPDQALVALDDVAGLLEDGGPSAWLLEPEVVAEVLAVHRPRSTGGFTVLLSGLSGSGKSTVARSLAARLVETGTRSVSLLDGDVVRHHLSKGLGFSRADRDTNVRRIGFVASEITKAGGIAIACPIAPYDATRRDVRAMVEAHGGFVLVHVATPLAECERRDRKGLYAKARRGEIPEFTGISDPYEVPTDAEAVVDTTGRDVTECVTDVVEALRRLGYLEG